jgi:hypothetical protein
MKKINHRNIRLISEDLLVYDTEIICEQLLPQFIIDWRNKLFKKTKTIFESGESRVTYSEILVTNLFEVEVSLIEAFEVNNEAPKTSAT